MDPHAQPVTVQRIDYAAVFRFTRLFECFRVAIHPSRLLLGLLLILSIYLGGRMLDVMWSQQVAAAKGDRLPVEFTEYVRRDAAEFAKFLAVARADAESDAKVKGQFRGVFDASLAVTLDLFERMIGATMRLDVGFDQVLPGAPINPNSIIGSIRQVFLVPAWLWDHHRGFFVAFLFMFTFFWSLLGGALSRSVMVEVASGRSEPMTRCILYAWQRLGWFILAPIIPILLVLVFGTILLVGGFVLFNWPVLDILGALLFIVALAVGFIMAVLIIGWFAGVHMMYPALAAEGTDAFDAVSRGYSYAFAHPWRLGWYTLIALVYGTATYLVVGLFIFVTLWGTHQFVGAGVFRDAPPPPSATAEPAKSSDNAATSADQPANPLADLTRDVLGGSPAASAPGSSDQPADAASSVPPLSRFDAMMPEPTFGRLQAEPASDRLGWSVGIASTLLSMWRYLILSLLAAYVIAFYLSAYSTIYLLLRRYTDGTDMSELYEEPRPAAPAPADKLEPTPPTQAGPEAAAAEGPGPAADADDT